MLKIKFNIYNHFPKARKAWFWEMVTATSYLNQLEEVELLESEKVGRERLYKNTRLIKLLSEN